MLSLAKDAKLVTAFGKQLTYTLPLGIGDVRLALARAPFRLTRAVRMVSTQSCRRRR
jgi:hypothetical protein